MIHPRHLVPNADMTPERPRRVGLGLVGETVPVIMPEGQAT
jgi:hypothetical protein